MIASLTGIGTFSKFDNLNQITLLVYSFITQFVNR